MFFYTFFYHLGSCATNKVQKLEDGLQETGETGYTWDTEDRGLTGSTVLRHDLTEIKPKMDEISMGGVGGPNVPKILALPDLV